MWFHIYWHNNSPLTRALGVLILYSSLSLKLFILSKPFPSLHLCRLNQSLLFHGQHFIMPWLGWFEYIVLLSWAIGTLALPHHDALHLPVNQLNHRALPVGTCNKATPCVNGACCGSNGLCGYSPTACGNGCTSDCNAKAECGQYGTPGKQHCPLNVCCSKFGLIPPSTIPSFPG